MTSSPPSGRDILEHCYRAAIGALEPETAMRRALRMVPVPDAPIAIIAAGKASVGMARGLVAWLAGEGRSPMGGVIVVPAATPSPHPALACVVGDHPLPGERSAQASEAIASAVAALPADAEVHVAISGGASALMAGPLPGLTMEDVTATFELLFGSGLDIHQSNAIRKRVTCWSAGRLERALRPRRVSTWLISDVPGDDVETIGSGPCIGDDWSSRDVLALCRRADLLDRLPAAVVAALEFETPKERNPDVAARAMHIVASNRVALDAAANAARALGCHVKMVPGLLHGEARIAGGQLAHALLRGRTPRATHATELADDAPRVLLTGGETTVALGDSPGRGGRNQELALAAAHELAGQGAELLVLAAGTDGRDGMTDAAGAIVDGTTWQRMLDAGIDAQGALDRHDSHPALDAVGVLLRTGLTGTNAMDIAMTMWDPRR